MTDFQWCFENPHEAAAEINRLAARLAELDTRLTDAVAKHGEVARQFGESQARLAEVIAERDSIRTMLLNERTEWMDEAIRRQASVNQNLAALVTDAQEELRKCQQDAIQLQARLAEAERNEETLLGMIRHQRDVLRECLPYINESMAGRRPGRSADDIRAAVKALTSDSASAVQPERCCLDYPRCDCNSPPEPDDDWLCFQRPAQPKVTP